MLGSILSGIGSIGSAIGNLFSTSSNNKTNLRIARETNQANKELYEQQFRDQYRMWLENNEYNDPSKQLARYRNAGLNPYLQNVESGQAQAMSVPSAAPMVGAAMEAPQFHFGDIAQNLALAAQASKTSKESQGIDMDNQFKIEMNKLQIKQQIAEIDSLLANKDLSQTQRQVYQAQRDNLERENMFFDQTFSQRVEQFTLNNDVLRAQKGNIEEQMRLAASQRAVNASIQALNMTQNRWFGRSAQAAIDKIFQDISTGKATQRNITADTLKKQMETAGQRISNSQARQMLPYVVKQAEYLPTLAEQQYREKEIERLRTTYDYYQREQDLGNPFNYLGKLLGSGGAAPFVKAVK